uniref:Uncharacterized protein n=1 Tax=Romanomermis culicivorax TaxID=13658 RepID=A0A915JZN8_ROMCU
MKELTKSITTSFLNVWRHSDATRQTCMTASGSSALTPGQLADVFTELNSKIKQLEKQKKSQKSNIFDKFKL